MPLRQDQTKEVLRLFQDGQSVDDIASGMHVAVADVQPFIPQGELLIAYQRVREAKLRLSEVTVQYDESNARDKAYLDDEDACAGAADELSVAIKESMAQTKALKATRKKIMDRLDAVITQIDASSTPALFIDCKERTDELAEFEDELELAKKADVLKRQKAADAVARKQRAARMSENALISAAVEAAKGVVSSAINKRLEREEASDRD